MDMYAIPEGNLKAKNYFPISFLFLKGIA